VLFAYFASSREKKAPGPAASADLAEAAVLVVDHRLPDLRGCVHHERSVARDWLVERLAADEQQFGSTLGCDHDGVAVALEDGHVVLLRLTVTERRLSAHHA